MKNKIKSILIDLGLVMVVLLLSLLFHAGFIAGPQRAMEHEDSLYVEAYQTKYDIKQTQLMNRFSLSDTFYIVKENDTLHWFNKALDKHGTHTYVPLDKAFEVASYHGMKPKHVSYGVYKDQVVFNLEHKNKVLFLDLETLDLLFEFGG